MLYHGTRQSLMEELRQHGLAQGAYVTADFDLAASYALRNFDPLVVEVSGLVEPPEEPAYDGELIAVEVLRVVRCLVPLFASWPADFYEARPDLSGRKYPELFDISSWREE